MSLAGLSRMQCEKVLELVTKEYLRTKDLDKRWALEKIINTFEHHKKVWE